MAEILFDEHDATGSHRTVRLSGDFSDTISELHAKMYCEACFLVRVCEDAQPATFTLSEPEMETLFAEWQAFKAARAEWQEAEKQDEPLSVAHVRIRPDDKNDLFALGIATAGPEHDLTVFFPDGTVRRDEGAYVFPGGSVASVEAGEVLLAVRTW